MSSDTEKKSQEKGVGKVHKLFEVYFPEHRTKRGALDVPGLAREMGYSHETLYKCTRNDVIKTDVARRIVEFSADRHPEQPLYYDDLVPFVLPDYEEYRDPNRK